MMQYALLAWILGMTGMGEVWSLTSATCVTFAVLWIINQILALKLPNFKPQFVRFLSISFLCLFSFNLAYLYADHALTERMALRELTSKSAEVIVHVKNLNVIQSNHIQQQVMVLDYRKQPVKWLAYIQPSSKTPLELGQYYRLRGKILPAHSYAIEGAFDQEKWFLQQNIMSAFQVQEIERLSEQQLYAVGQMSYLRQQQSSTAKFLLAIERQRLSLRNTLRDQSLHNTGLLLALLTGDQSLLSPDVEDLFKRMGLSHLLAISGPHVLIFAALLCWSLHRLIIRFNPTWYLHYPKPYLLVLPFCMGVLLYSAFVGFEIPALRTLFTSLIITVLILCKFKLQPVQILLFSAAILLFFDPFSILSAAFWLSYGACLVLLRIYQTLQQQPTQVAETRLRQLKSYVVLLFESQWKIFIALLPLMLIFFQQVVWIAPFSNIVALPWLSILVVPLSIIATLCLWIFKPLGLLLFQLNDFSLSLLLSILNGADQIVGSTVQSVAMSWAVMFGLILGLCILFLPRGVVPKSWVVVCVLPIFIFDESKQSFELQILDVGQGQAIYLQKQDQQMMIDMGGNYDEQKFSVGQQIIRPFLNSKGVSHLDQLILTHLDQDHSGAYYSLRSILPIQTIYSNEKVEVMPESQFHYCHAGQLWEMEGVKIQVLSPRKEQLAEVSNHQNELSCVLYIQVEHAQPYANFLIMGDAGWETEYQILKAYSDLKVDVLVLGHHGSKHSSAYDFLKRLKPKIAIASAGFSNRYGHPSILTQQRLNELQIPLYTTIDNGSIQFIQTEDQQIQMQFYRDQQRWLNR
ncbi:DNA internalization-related competence protein ComEC/Rec2 [Acinetobacter zhairhuonensis]|uniref:DNA internalization-related competence protein ComEC/Rec2 n=1 Tax=Acinetobacter sp. A7.4 TaxID=2919921 RepID=UPI001F4F5951|nr:DNA internalization-related competence protein ComEC/Rec2 [Acinetobacter sp. A7.4]MCJ8162026.1 DNA internalization-related competence protein ComEC/Rec2 [Acinetobacter sp. A7.4]